MSALTTFRRAVQTATPVLALGTAALTAALAACSDSPTGPTPAGAAQFAAQSTGTTVAGTSAGQGGTASAITSQQLVGDTTVTTFVLGTDGRQAMIRLDAQNTSQVVFPIGLFSVCDPATSSYGIGTWDSACTAASKSITITAKVWTDKTTGKTVSDFQPALRFVPGQKWPVQLYLKDPTYTAGDVIWYCPSGSTYTTGTGTTCVNEALTDPSLTTSFASRNGWAYRTIKHFSGYLVSWNRN